MRSSSSTYEVILITGIFAGWFIFSSVHAVVAGFPDAAITDQAALVLIAFECIAFAAAAAVLWTRGWRARDLAFRVTWWYSFAGVLLFGVTLLLSFGVWDLLGQSLGGREFLIEFANAIALSFPVALLLAVLNGAYEEFFLTRYLVDTLARYGASVALGVSALVRMTYHLYQGPLGAVSVLAFGLVVTVFYWRFGELWPVMFAHMLADLAAFL
jgi:membrane protease YdiL (CAAX protease family)